MALQLEQYLDNLETLPVEMKRNFNLMKDLDQRSFNTLQKIDSLVHGYLATAKNLTADKRTRQTKEIEDNFVKAKSFCDDKVTLAQQTYDMVDKHIRRLDNDLARFEGQLKQRLLAENKGNQKKRKRADDHAPAGGRRKKLDMKQFEDEMPRISDKKKKKQLVELKQVPSVDPMSLCNLSGQALIQTLASAAGDVLDMPVDPNEPTYCLCHQVSYGEMIGCDNEDCPIEWFHFGCVGLSNKPKGKWYCPRCSENRKKK